MRCVALLSLKCTCLFPILAPIGREDRRAGLRSVLSHGVAWSLAHGEPAMGTYAGTEIFQAPFSMTRRRPYMAEEILGKVPYPTAGSPWAR